MKNSIIKTQQFFDFESKTKPNNWILIESFIVDEPTNSFELCAMRTHKFRYHIKANILYGIFIFCFHFAYGFLQCSAIHKQARTHAQYTLQCEFLWLYLISALTIRSENSFRKTTTIYNNTHTHTHHGT